ncbi:hypothetical protein [Carboxylicivirga marina]|uniref:Uncharacterized protein n=1 Tax=Carboxylicivirga marina TaxID=2800988 RepID=A0ABS1HLD7_9BACT|nr:hypothetical protein [Carboxylicivirga marina]MBK3518487.1 hypothetical protein [Carboxylicivirga marina]
MEIIAKPPENIVKLIDEDTAQVNHPIVKTRDKLLEINSNKYLLATDLDVIPIVITNIVFNDHVMYVHYKGTGSYLDFEGMTSVDLYDTTGGIGALFFISIEWHWDQILQLRFYD